MRPSPLPRAMAALALLAVPSSAAAQTSEVSVEVGGSRVLPPTGVDGDAAAFLVGGLRGSRYDFLGTGVYGAVQVGHALDAATGGDFVSGEVGGAAWRALAGGWAAGVEAKALAFSVQDPFPYRAVAGEGAVVLRYRGDVLRARAAATGGAGRSRVTLTEVVQRMRRHALVTEVLEDDLWRWGGTAEFLAGRGAAAGGVAAGVHRTPAGTYRSVGARLVVGGTRGALETRADAWRTPDGTRWTGGVAFYLPWGGWSARGAVGRPDPDPLLLADPGRQASGVLLGRRVLGSGPVPLRAGRPLHRLLDATPRGARVRFAVSPPSGATRVALLGDFTLWDPVAMTAAGGSWTVELDVPAGTHHFGFLVDGAWYLPDDAPDAVPDEWGRASATLVIEGAGEP